MKSIVKPLVICFSVGAFVIGAAVAAGALVKKNNEN